MKRILSTTLAAMMILTLAGCNNDTESELREEIDRLQSEIDEIENKDATNNSDIMTLDANDITSTVENTDDETATVATTETEIVEPDMYMISNSDENYEYRRLEDGGVEIVGIQMVIRDAASSFDNWYVTYPLRLGGSPVVSAYIQTDWDDHITVVEFEDGYTRIPDYALRVAEGLETVIMPDTVTEIGKSAFDYCTALINIQLPEGLTTIGEYAFNHCETLTAIDIPDSVTTIANNTFYACENIEATYRGKTYTYDMIDQLYADINANSAE